MIRNWIDRYCTGENSLIVANLKICRATRQIGNKTTRQRHWIFTYSRMAFKWIQQSKAFRTGCLMDISISAAVADPRAKILDTSVS